MGHLKSETKVQELSIILFYSSLYCYIFLVIMENSLGLKLPAPVAPLPPTYYTDYEGEIPKILYKTNFIFLINAA